jgi:hypothetical protein
MTEQRETTEGLEPDTTTEATNDQPVAQPEDYAPESAQIVPEEGWATDDDAPKPETLSVSDAINYGAQESQSTTQNASAPATYYRPSPEEQAHLDDQQLRYDRQQALSLAVASAAPTGNTEKIIARAQRFLNFVQHGEAPTAPVQEDEAE